MQKPRLLAGLAIGTAGVAAIALVSTSGDPDLYTCLAMNLVLEMIIFSAFAACIAYCGTEDELCVSRCVYWFLIAMIGIFLALIACVIRANMI